MNKGTRTFIYGLMLVALGSITVSNNINRFKIEDTIFIRESILLIFGIIVSAYGFSKIQKTIK